MPRTSPTIRRRRLAAELRKLRLELGITPDEAADVAMTDRSNLLRWEAAKTTANPASVGPLLRHYGVAEEDIPSLVQMARDARKRGWWQGYNSALPEWFQMYVGLETEAVSIEEYQPLLIPGLLQTSEYARAVIRAEYPHISGDDVKRRVELRMQRQERDDTPEVWAIISEAALHVRVGGEEVMADQLRHLHEAAGRPHHTVQVLPAKVGEHGSMASGFIVLRFADADTPVVYFETRAGSLYVEEESEVAQYTAMYRQLTASALGNRESALMIKEAINKI